MIRFQNPFNIFKKIRQVAIDGSRAYEIMLFLILYESFVLLFFLSFRFCLFVCFFIEANVDESNYKKVITNCSRVSNFDLNLFAPSSF